jgi:hypothetical protein
VIAPTRAHLKALIARPVAVALVGRITPGDGLGGVYFWAPGSTVTADDVYVIAPNAAPAGRWLAFGQFGGGGGGGGGGGAGTGAGGLPPEGWDEPPPPPHPVRLIKSAVTTATRA